MDHRDHDLDPVLPAQFFLRHPDTPERRLLAAVLEDAVRTYQQLSTARDFRGRRLFREVEEWFASERADDPFAFVRICEVLGLDRIWFRGGLACWRTRQNLPHTVHVRVASTPTTMPTSRTAS